MSRMITAAHCLLVLLPSLPLAAQTEEVTLRIETTDRYQRRHQRILTGALLDPQEQYISIRTDRKGERCIPVDPSLEPRSGGSPPPPPHRAPSGGRPTRRSSPAALTAFRR